MTVPAIYCNECGASNALQATHCFACNHALPSPGQVQATFTNAAVPPGKIKAIGGPLVPSTLLHSRYIIVSQIGTGGFGAVYQAKDTLFSNSLVAIKEMNQDGLSPQELVEATAAFEHEAHLLAGLTHPNLPRIHDHFTEHGRSYVVMDYIAGDTLEDYLNKVVRRLPVEAALEIGIQLCAVLDYLQTHRPPLGVSKLTLHTIWRTPDGTLYPLDIETLSQATATSGSNSVANLGKILRQLQTGKTPSRSRLYGAVFALPRLYGRFSYAKHSQSTPLTVLIRQMTHKNVRNRPYSMGLVKQELQHLAMQCVPPSSLKKRIFSRRTLFRLGKIAGLAGVATVASSLTWAVEYQNHRQYPTTSYSPNIGGTIYTYVASDGVLAVAWSPNGTRIVTGEMNDQVFTWDANTGHHPISYLKSNQRQNIEAVTWLPDGNFIAASGDDSFVWVWNAANGNIQTTYSGHTDGVITVACSPDGKYMASGSMDQTIHVWETATGRQIVIYRGHSSGIGSVTWSPDGRYIASASFDRTVQVWEATTGRLVFIYHGHTQGVYTVAWSPDGQHIASGGKDLTVQVWPVTFFTSNEQPPKGSIITYRGHTRAVQAVAWSPDSYFVASTGENVQLWNGLTGKHIYTYTKHSISVSLEVQAVAWSPNGKYIASGGLEGTVQVWNAR